MLFEQLLGDGSKFGLALSYAVQDKPRGLADAFVVGRQFIGLDRVALILGDNIFYGAGLPKLLQRASARVQGATVFAYMVSKAEHYSVVQLDHNGKAISIEEKPRHPQSSYAVTGLYFFDNSVVEIAATISPSARGEIDITDVNRAYMRAGALHVEIMGRGYAWLDAGTDNSLIEAAQFVQVLEQRQGLRIACPEEIAFRSGYITGEQLLAAANLHAKSGYGQYLRQVLKAPA